MKFFRILVKLVLGVVGIIVVFYIGLIIVILALHYVPQKLLDKFPAYSNSLSYAHIADSDFPYPGCNIIEHAETQEVLLSSDNPSKIASFYAKLGATNGWEQSSSYRFGGNINNLNILCFQGKGGDRWYPINAVEILDHLDPKDAESIAAYFPNTTPPNTNLILLSQGYWLGD
jgi:hypothetical protein